MTELRPYQTLAEFQQAHEDLLERFDARADAPPAGAADEDARERHCLVAMMDPLRQFMQRAAAGGAYLYESRERRAAQGLLDYWASLCYGANLDLPRPLLAPHDARQLPQLSDDDCPYVGLDAFGEGNAANFFGRGDRVQALLQRLADERLVVVTGASGSGKSSLVLAGLMPALRAGGLPGSGDWAYPAPLVPGATPLANLVAALRPGAADAEAWQARLRDQPEALPALLGERAHVLVVDQFEEVMTLRSEANAADFNTFVAALQSAVGGGAVPHRLVLTMRNDVDTQLAREYPDLNRRYGSAAFPLVSMDSAQLREAIEGPAQRVGLKFQEGVVDELIRSVVGEDAGLPLLQFSLMSLWDRRHGNLVTLEALQAVGSPRRAMTVAAERLYAELDPGQQLTARNLFLALSRQGDGVTVFRNRVSRRRLHEVGERNAMDRVVQRFEQARLLRVTRRDTPEDDLVEVAHEALLRNWEMLQQLFSERRDERERRAFLRKQALKWREAKFDDAFLLSGLALRQARDEIERAGMAEVERNFLDRSIEKEQAVERARDEEHARRLRLQEQETLAALRVSRSRLMLLTATGVGALLLAAVAGAAIYGWNQAQSKSSRLVAQAEDERSKLIAEADRKVADAKQAADLISAAAAERAAAAASAALAAQQEQSRANAQLVRSETARLMTEAANAVDGDAERAVFYATEAARRDPALLPRAAPVVIDALRYRRAELRLRPEQLGAVSALTLNAAGDRMLVAGDQQLREWDLKTLARTERGRAWPAGASPIRQVSYLGAGGDMALATEAAIWVWQGQAPPHALQPRFGAQRITASPDGRWLAAISDDSRTVKVWSLPDGQERLSHRQPDDKPKLASPIFDVSQNLAVALVPDSDDPRAEALRFERQGDGFAAVPQPLRGGSCNSSRVVYAAGGTSVSVLKHAALCVEDVGDLGDGSGAAYGRRQSEVVDDVIVSPSGRFVVKLVRVTGDAVVEELGSGRTLRLQAAFDLGRSSNYENVVAVSDAGERLAIKGQDGSIRLYGLGASSNELAGRDGVLWVSDDERLFISRAATVAHGYELRETITGKTVRSFTAPRLAPRDPFALSRDGRWLQARAGCTLAGGEAPVPAAASRGTGERDAPEGEQVWVHDLARAGVAPASSPCAPRLTRSDGLYLLEGKTELAVYAAALQRVVWRLPVPPAGAVRPGMRPDGVGVLLGEEGRFVVRRVADGQATAEAHRLAGDTLHLERSWQWPAPRGWSVSLLGRGRALMVTAGAGSAVDVWDLHRERPTSLPVRDGARYTSLGPLATVLATRATASDDWQLRDAASGQASGTLPAWMEIDDSGRFAYGGRQGRWQLRRLDDPARILLQGEGEPRRWLFDPQARSLALNFAEGDQLHVYRLSDGALRLQGRFSGLRSARLTGAGNYLLIDDGRLLPVDAQALMQSARAAVTARYGPAERCRLLMDEAACRQALAAGARLRSASTSR